MPISRQDLFSKLLNRFLLVYADVEAIIVSDEEGMTIAGEKRKDMELDIVSTLSTVVNPILDRIRSEFAFKKFGTAAFDTDDFRLLFISIDNFFTLILVLKNSASIDEIAPYGMFLAERVAQILATDDYDSIQTSIPDFKFKTESLDRLKKQLYTMEVESGKIYRFKFIILGDFEVGKTSLCRRFIDNKFSSDYRATIGLNILTHDVKFMENDVSLLIWDISGQDIFKRYRKIYYTGAQAAFIVFDVTNRKSFENIKKWYDELRQFLPSAASIPLIIIGNKADLTDKRAVDYKDISNIANILDAGELSKFSYVETSALSGLNVNEAFNLIIYQYLMKESEKYRNIIKDELFSKISEILKKKKKFNLTIFTENPLYNPALQIIADLAELGSYQAEIDNELEKHISYSNGLNLKSFAQDLKSVKETDAIYCLFDGRKVEHVKNEWKVILNKIMDQISPDKTVVVGVQVSEALNWSSFMKEFETSIDLEKKMVALMFFKIEENSRTDVFEQLKILLDSVKFST